MDIRNRNNGFSYQRTGDTFPHGLRVLVVDDDLTWLKIIEKMLNKCFYQVTTCCLAREALNILRERKNGFDIVISDVNMPDMDGFKLLEYVGLEMDLPVIMMSVDGETSRVMKGIQHGACDYLLKPIRMKELKNIWQHVIRKKKNEQRDFEGLKGIEKIQVPRSGISDQSDDGYLFCGSDLNLGKKRKGFESRLGDKEFAELSAVKKTRVVWTVELHQKFVKTVNHIGFDKIGPKKILDLMNVPWLTRENVASHLQKYRLYLSRLQKEDDIKSSFSGIIHSDLSFKEQVGSRNIKMKKNDGDHNCMYGIPGSAVIQNAYPNNYVGESVGMISFPLSTLNDDYCEIQKASISEMNLIHTSGSTDANYLALSSFIPSQCPWSRNVSGIEIKQDCRPQLEMKTDFNHLPFPDVQNQFSNNFQFTPTFYQTPINSVIDNLPNVEIRTACSNQNIPKQTPGVAFELCLAESNCGIGTCFHSEPITRSTWNMENQAVDHISANDLVTHLTCLNEAGLLPEDHFLTSLEQQNKEFSDSNNLELFTDVSPYVYDEMKFL